MSFNDMFTHPPILLQKDIALSKNLSSQQSCVEYYDLKERQSSKMLLEKLSRKAT